MEINVNNNNPPDFPERLLVIEARGVAMFEQIEALKKDVDANTRMTKVNTDMTTDVHEVLMYARSGINAIGKFGRGLAMVGRGLRKVVIWTTPIVVGAVAVYHAAAALLHWKSGP